MYVLAVSIRGGKECEVYSDAFSKVILFSCHHVYCISIYVH